MTRPDFSMQYIIPYSTVTDRVRRDDIAPHFIDNNVQSNIEEALNACILKRQRRSVRENLFA